MKWVYGGKNRKLRILTVNICPSQKPPLLLADSLCTFHVTASGLKKVFKKLLHVLMQFGKLFTLNS